MQYAPRPARNVPRNLPKGIPPRFHKLSAHPDAQGIREFRQTSTAKAVNAAIHRTAPTLASTTTSMKVANPTNAAAANRAAVHFESAPERHTATLMTSRPMW